MPDMLFSGQFESHESVNALVFVVFPFPYQLRLEGSRASISSNKRSIVSEFLSPAIHQITGFAEPSIPVLINKHCRHIQPQQFSVRTTIRYNLRLELSEK